MILPISVNCTTAAFGRAGKKANNGSSKMSKSDSALIGATGVAVITGGLTTALGRGVTESWLHAGILGFFSASLVMFFMTPHIIKSAQQDAFVKKNSVKEQNEFRKTLIEYFKPSKKMVPFKQN